MNAPEKVKQYDRAAETVGNMVHLEHFNVLIDDQRLAIGFHVMGLGGTRDPYIFTGLENIWINFGRTQIHMPSRGNPPKPEVVRGTIGLVVPDLGELKKRLDRDAVVINDGGDIVSYSGKYIESYEPGCWLDPGPYGCLGTGMGYAIAARLARPD